MTSREAVVRERLAHPLTPGTAVQVDTLQGSRYDGRQGTVQRVVGDVLIVRFVAGLHHAFELPFGRGEVRRVS